MRGTLVESPAESCKKKAERPENYLRGEKLRLNFRHTLARFFGNEMNENRKNVYEYV
jgi:hypothetical protein